MNLCGSFSFSHFAWWPNPWLASVPTPSVLGTYACESHAGDDHDDDNGDGLSEIYCHYVLYIHCAHVLGGFVHRFSPQIACHVCTFTI